MYHVCLFVCVKGRSDPPEDGGRRRGSHSLRQSLRHSSVSNSSSEDVPLPALPGAQHPRGDRVQPGHLRLKVSASNLLHFIAV